MLTLVKHTTADFTAVPKTIQVKRAFPNRYFLYESSEPIQLAPESLTIEVPSELHQGLRYFDIPNNKRLRINTVGPEVETIPETGRLRIQYSDSQLEQRIAFKRWLALNVYLPEMIPMGLFVRPSVLRQLENETDDSIIDTLIQENFYYDL